MPDVEHSTLASADCHEPKHISGATASDAGKVITPSSTAGVSELRKLKLIDLDLSGTQADPISGWQYWADNSAGQSGLTARTKLLIDGLASDSNTTYKPQNASNWWNTSTNLITPDAQGDAYDMRVEFTINFSAGTGTLYYTVDLDINSGGGGLIVASQDFVVPKGTGVNVACIVSWPVFVGSTFIANGGAIYVTPGGGGTPTCTITNAAIYLAKTHRAA